MLRTSEKCANVAASIHAIQKELRPLNTDKINPFFHSKYADLVQIWGDLRPRLAEHGVVVVQSPGRDGELITITTRITDIKSGEWIEGTAAARPVKDDPQAAGSVITYLRRYALVSLFGYVAESEDDDGNAGVRQGKTYTKKEK